MPQPFAKPLLVWRPRLLSLWILRDALVGFVVFFAVSVHCVCFIGSICFVLVIFYKLLIIFIGLIIKVFLLLSRRRRVRLVLFVCFVVLKDFWHLIKRNQIDILNNLNKQTDITIASPPRLACLVRVLSSALSAYWNALWPEANWRGGWCCSFLSLSPGLSPSRVAKNR